jgi:DNA-binding NarL/FixJ family response regulator
VSLAYSILLVDDFAPFRRFVGSALEPMPEFRIVGEAVDGLEAVEKAKELQPELILLDVGLPKLSGLAAAERILAVVPQTKILFISLESSTAVVQEAFRSGARGYLNKLRAQTDLIAAIEAVLAGRQFVSRDLEFKINTEVRRRHEVLFYQDDSVLLESAARFVAGALKADGAAIVLATTPHHESLVEKLKADACDVNTAIQQGTYVSLDAANALSEIMVNGTPDQSRFFKILSGLIETSTKAAKTEHPRVAIFGECLALLYAVGDAEGVIQIERTGRHLFDTYDVDILCAYPLRDFQRSDTESVFKSICAEHTAVYR